MHKNPEFQAVVLAAGRGSRLPDVGGSVSKCLLPVGPYPVLWYSLHLLEKMGFQETMVVVLDEDNSNILNALERCPLKIKYELIVIPSDEDWGTANTLKHISSRVVTDLLVISGDLITNINLNDVLNLYRKHDAALTALYFNNGPEEWIELPGPKTKAKPDRDLVCIDKETQRLVFVASASDFEENVTLPRLLIKKFSSISMYSRLLDAHVFVMKHWVVNYLVAADKFISVKGELVPHIVKKQLAKPKNAAEKKGMSEKNVDISKDIFDYAVEHGYEKKVRKMSHYNDHQLGSKGVYYNDILRCYAYVADKNTFGTRVNTLSAFYLSNSKILSKWEELTGSALTEKFHPSSDVKTKQIDETCIVGDKSVVSEKTSIKNSFIGANCTVENKVRLTNCILMNNVVIKEGCVLQDCVVYTGAIVEMGCQLTYCLIGPHHIVPASSSENSIMKGKNYYRAAYFTGDLIPAEKMITTVKRGLSEAVLTTITNSVHKIQELDKLNVVSGETEAKYIQNISSMTGISLRTIRQIKHEGNKNSGIWVTPGKKRKCRATKRNIDDFDKVAIRNIINEFYLVRNEVPTVAKLLSELRQSSAIQFDGGYETLRKILHDMGFCFKKNVEERIVLMEKNDIAAARHKYIRKITEYRNMPLQERKPIVYLDETYIHVNYKPKKSWQGPLTSKMVTNISKGKRYIIVHAGTESGFVDNALLIFSSKSKSADYHDEMNATNFSKWVQDKLLPNLDTPSIIVMDNASYHTIQINRAPNTNARKQVIRDWLTSNNIPWEEIFTKAELLTLVKRNKPDPIYYIDELLKANGHEVLRLPPYHCHLNTIELIWSMVKRKVGSLNVKGSIRDMTVKVEQAFASVTSDDWRKCAEHVKKLESEHRQQDGLLDDQIPFVINVQSDDDTDIEGTTEAEEGVEEYEEVEVQEEVYEGVEFLDTDMSYSE